MLGAVQARDERTVLDAKEPQQTKDTDGGTEGKHMARPPTALLHKGHHFPGDSRLVLPQGSRWMTGRGPAACDQQECCQENTSKSKYLLEMSSVCRSTAPELGRTVCREQRPEMQPGAAASLPVSHSSRVYRHPWHLQQAAGPVASPCHPHNTLPASPERDLPKI